MGNKKIVFIINNFLIGGVEQLLFGIISHLVHAGYEVHVVSILGSGPLEVKFAEIPVPIHHAGPRSFAGKKLPFKLYWLIIAPFTVIRLIRILRKIKSDLVVTSLYQADTLGMFAAWMCGTKKRVLIQHDVQTFGVLRKYFKQFFGLTLATHVVANSDTTKQFMISYWNLSPDKITIIPNGVDIQKFEEAIKPINSGELTLGIVGRLEPVKGHRTLLEALDLLKNKGLEPRVIIVGGGSLEQQLKKNVAESGLHRILFTGQVVDIIENLKSIDILIIPSLEEGFGLVVLEGLFARKIVVASKIDAFLELIEPDVTGVLFEPGDSVQLAEKLKELITSPLLVEKYQHTLESLVESKKHEYDIKNTAKRYLELFFEEEQ